MHELTVTDEFERWFDALDEEQAEQVTSALDVVEAAGPAVDPVTASRLLLWYEATRHEPMFPGGAAPWLVRACKRAADDLRDLMLWQREAVRCLESPALKARLAVLDRASAVRALDAVERIKNRVRAMRTHIALGSFWRSEGRMGTSNPAHDAVRDALDDALRLVGMRHDECIDASSGLRELTIGCDPVPLRVIYGIDVPRRRVLVLLGEALDRAYYGDSVRWAEKRWRAYVQSDEIKSEEG